MALPHMSCYHGYSRGLADQKAAPQAGEKGNHLDMGELRMTRAGEPIPPGSERVGLSIYNSRISILDGAEERNTRYEHLFSTVITTRNC